MNMLIKNKAEDTVLQESLLNSPLFFRLPYCLQQKLYGIGSLSTFNRDDDLFREEHKIKTIYYLLSGTCKEFYIDESGEEYIRRSYRPGNYISLHSAFSEQQLYSYYCSAITAATSYSFPREKLNELISDNPQLAGNVISILSEEYESSCRKSCLHKKPQAMARVAGYILRRSKTLCISPDCRCNLKSCHGQIDIRPISLSASNISLSRETFSRVLTRLHRQNIIKNHRGLLSIIDEDKLKKICGININL